MVTTGCMFILSEGVKELRTRNLLVESAIWHTDGYFPGFQLIKPLSKHPFAIAAQQTPDTRQKDKIRQDMYFRRRKITGKVTCLWLESQVSHTNISFLCVFFPAVQEKDSHWLILGNLPCIGWSSISIPFVYRRIPSILGNCPRLLLNMVDSRSDSAINTSGRTGDCFCLHRLSNPLEGNQTNTSLFNLTLQDEQC